MAALAKIRFKHGPLDQWSTKEQLALASSVMRSGDQNWVSVSRSVKPHGEPDRPSDWFSQKNCALQYSELLEKVETPKRKRGEKGEATDTLTEQIVRKLTEQRIEELKKIVIEQQQKYKKLKKDIEVIKSGQLDDKLPEIWDAMLEERKQAQQLAMENRRRSADKTETQVSNKQKKISEMKLGPPMAVTTTTTTATTTTVVLQDLDDTTNDSLDSGGIDVSVLSDDSLNQPLLAAPTTMTLTIPPPILPTADGRNKSGPPTSPLLSSLLQSKLKSADSLQLLKLEAEEKHQQQILANQAAAATEAANLLSEADVDSKLNLLMAPTAQIETSTPTVTPTIGAPTLSKLLFPPINTIAGMTVSTQSVTGSVVVDKPAMTLEIKTESEECFLDPNIQVKEEIIRGDNSKLIDIEHATEVVVTDGDSQTTTSTAPDDPGQVSQDESEAGSGFPNIEIKEEPPSPASSVSSKISESGGKSTRSKSRRSTSSRGGKKSKRITRRSVVEKDDTSSKHSEAEFTDDDLARESDETGSITTTLHTGSALWVDSVPNSPASLSMCSDTEDEKAFKIWKKSIMLVWRTAANHKYANVFTHPVTNEIAPGYLNVVHRPMNLTLIKRNIESGVLRTTSEFQRDMMLMFTNAIMYNSSDHNVYKMAVEMYDDVMESIEQFVHTQLMVASNEAKSLRTSRRSETVDKDEDPKKRRPSCDQPPEGGKTKRRKTRADDT
ncbi:bromodomain-containing protein 8 [Patella vulgata]|uniref:bromodomain-containing protein 8 n=1 Tax=Patella vulgata TaxID=6465 RepID=UPI00217F665B|nr:bromodomain-containing protein 8 [Patella vulgata]